MNSKRISIESILELLDDEVVAVYGSTTGSVMGIADMHHADSNTLDWINQNRSDAQSIAEMSSALFILANDGVTYTESLHSRGRTLIIVKNPKKAIALIGNAFFVDSFEPGIHNTCIIDNDAVISPSATICPYVHIGKARIGNGTVIGSNVRIHDNVVIGDHCFIKEGAVIGGQGFGYEIDEDGNRYRFPQIGGVIIGNHVDIGSNTCIDRGAFSDTVVEDYAKIDNLCHIAHNVHVGRNAVITACAEISGSCYIGENAWIGPNTSVRDWRGVGSASIIGIGANVVKSVPDGEVWAGNPAKRMA